MGRTLTKKGLMNMTIWIGILGILAGAFWLAFQYLPGDERLFILFFFASAAVCVLYFLSEHKKRTRIIEQITRILDGLEDPDAVSPDNVYTMIPELRELERRAVLRQKNAAAKEARICKGYENIAALVSDISHQCKTPLSSIIMYADTLPDRCKKPGEWSDVIVTQTEKLRFLMEALTKLSKCESGLISENLAPSVNSVTELICHTVSEIYPSAERKNMEIISDGTAGITASFDMRWTKEALFNILDNAVKYSPADSEIRISTEIYDMFVRINIADSGPGIPEDEINDIWKRFYRGKGGKNHSANGVGIGLYLTQRILESEGGYISVKSEPGKGCVFSVFLPRK